MARHRTHSLSFKRQVAQEYLGGETLHGLAKRHDLSRNLIRLWVEKYEAGTFDDDARAADVIQACEARIAGPERLVGKQALGARVSKGGAARRGTAEKRAHVRDRRPDGLSSAEGCRLMGFARSTFYGRSDATGDDTALVEALHAIRDAFEAYGWRRMQAALRQQGWAVNHKKIKRLMREHGLPPPCRRRFVATTDNDHDQGISVEETIARIIGSQV